MDAEFNEKCANEALMLHLESELESLRQENSRLREELKQKEDESEVIQLRGAKFQLHIILDQKEAELKRLREALATWLKWWDHEVSGTEKGRIYRWTEELLNPPKRS